MRQKWLTVVLVALAIATASNTFGVTGKASQSQVDRGLALGQLDSCIRDNVKSATDNSTHLSNYRSLTQQITFTETTLHADYLALQKVGIPKKVLNVALRNSEAALHSQQAQLATLTWTSLVDCAGTPTPRQGLEVHSIATERPPLSAMSVKNALRATPVGSTLTS